MNRLLKILGAWGLMAFPLSACIVEQQTPTLHTRSMVPELPSRRIHPDGGLPDSLQYGRLNGERMEAQRRRLEKIAHEHLALEPDSRYDIGVTRILFEPADRQRILLDERFAELPIEATPVLLVVEGGKVVLQEGHLHRPPEDFAVEPRIDRVSAEELARIYVSSLPNALAASVLVIRYDAESARLLLAWRVDLPRQRVWIDAVSGNMIDHETRAPASTGSAPPPNTVLRPQRIAR